MTMNQTSKIWLNILSECADFIQKKDGPFKARGIQKGIDLLATCKDNVTLDDLKSRGMPQSALLYLKEYVSNGFIEMLEAEKKKPEYNLMQVYGIGMVKARDLVKQGITSIDLLKTRKDLLNPTQKKGLTYVESTIKRIPREEIVLYKHEIQSIMSAVAPPNSTFEIVGSFRRGASDSGDIDVIFCQKDNILFLPLFLKEAIQRGFVVETLSNGPIKCLAISTLPNQNTEFRRIDFLYSPPKEYYFAILYFTGSKWFNTAMRQRALDLGYSLNEHGFTIKENGNKVEMKITNEQDIFDFLHMEYKEPHERVDCNSVVIIEKNKPLIQCEANYLNELNQKGGSYLQSRTKEQLAKMIRYATDKYSIGEPVISDEQFDFMKSHLESIDPSNPVLQEVGSEVSCDVLKKKVKLPYNMPSMDKIKPDTSALTNWVVKYSNNYVISAKLDGISALYSTNPCYLYTRGNGKIGQDISYLIPYLNLPVTEKQCVIRGEIIISKETFKQYGTHFANPRNLTAGIVNSTTEDEEKYNSLDFVAYEVIQPEMKPHEQMKHLSTLHIKSVIYTYSAMISNDLLGTLLQKWKKTYDYEIDGIIITHDKIYPRLNGNPKHAFAYKMMASEDILETLVMDVLWTPSKDGYLKPRLLLQPIQLNGSSVSYVTAFNGKYVETNQLGPGSKVMVGLSGGVIPHIFKITHSTEAKMPSDNYVWSKNDVDIVLCNPEDNDQVQMKQMLRFFDTLEVDGLKAGTIKQLMSAGYNSVAKIIAMNESDFETVDGFGKKKSHKVYTSIQDKINTTSCIALMCASNTFGRGMGEKKLSFILKTYPNILTSTETIEEKKSKVSMLKGMSEKTSDLFVDYIDNFMDFIKEAKLEYKLESIQQPTSIANTNHPLYGKHIVFSGFRDKDLMKKLTDIGVELTSSVSSNTFLVIMNSNEPTGKSIQANKLHVPIALVSDFIMKYKLD